MAKVDHDSFMSIQGWMLTDYGLRGDHLIAFAVIHGFSQDGAGWYYGGREYLAGWLGCSTKKVSRILNTMVDQGLIVRQQVEGKSGKCYKYQSAVRDKTSHSNETNSPIQEDNMSHSKGQKEPIERDKTSHINIKETLTEPETNNKKRFQKPTVEQIKEYATERGYPDFDAEYFWDYWESRGWRRGGDTIKDWKAAFRNWVKRNKNQNQPSEDIYDNEYAYVF